MSNGSYRSYVPQPRRSNNERAPKIKQTGPKVGVLAQLNGQPVLVRERSILAATFHPELTEDDRTRRLLVEMVRAREDQVTLAAF